METIIAFSLMLTTLVIFAYFGFKSASLSNMDSDKFLSARGTQNWVKIGLSLFASGMGIWVFFGPSEVGYFGGFWDVLGYAVACATPFYILYKVGPIIREKLPSGVTLADYVRIRIGRPMQIYVGIISIIYMFTILFAEFTAIGKAMKILGGIEPIYSMITVAVVTTAYTTYGGLPSSLGTDRIQAWVLIWLLVTLLLLISIGDFNAIISDAKRFNPEDPYSIGSISYMDSFSSGLALVLAITSAEMFSQGNWQRAWASEDDNALRKGSILAATLVLPLIFIMGFLGTTVAGRGTALDPASAFFILLDDASIIIISGFIVLGTALVCSSVDTLQNAIAASVTRDISDGRLNINQSRLITLGMIPLALYLATGPEVFGYRFDTLGVFKIYLFADLLAAATVIPILLTLWEKINPSFAFLGALSGLLSVILYGTISSDFSTGLRFILSPTNEFGLANLNVFISALAGSTLVTVLGSYVMQSDD